MIRFCSAGTVDDKFLYVTVTFAEKLPYLFRKINALFPVFLFMPLLIKATTKSVPSLSISGSTIGGVVVGPELPVDDS